MNKPLEPAKVDYNALPVDVYDLPLVKPPLKVAIKRADASGKQPAKHYVAVTEYDRFLETRDQEASVLNTIELPEVAYTPSDPKDSIEAFSNIFKDRNRFMPEFVVANNNNSIKMDRNIVTQFYFGSVTIVGLYIFYRIIVKNT